MAKNPKQIKTLKDLVPDPANINKGTQRGLSALDHSARKFGVGRGVVVDKNGVIIAGNKTVERLADLGITKIKPVHTSGDELVVTVRDDLDLLSKKDRRARGLALADNRVGELDYDPDAEALAALAKDERELLEGLWNDSEINEILGAEAGTQDAEPQIDKADELLKTWKVERGQLWGLGEHRLICGDCTEESVVESVMLGDLASFCFTDPPYGVKYTGGTKKWTMLENDDEVNMYAASLPVIKKFTEEKCALYLAFASANARSVYNTLFDNGYTQRALIIWNKNHAQFGSMGAQYKQKHEPIAYCFRSGSAPHWFGPNNEVTVWDIDRQSRNEYHPTEKPVELYMRAMLNSAPDGCVVFEPFAGSGTSIISSENTGRKCRAVEISPAYVSVILQRYLDATGKTPVLLNG